MRISNLRTIFAAFIVSLFMLGAGTATADTLSQRHDPPTYPDCDDSIQLTSIAYNASTDQFRFKVVVVDVARWLRPGRTGKLNVVGTSSSHGTQHPGGPYTIDYGGFVSPLLYIKSDRREAGVNTWITDSRGVVRCQYRTTIRA